MPLITNYRENAAENYVDLGTKFVTKDYLMEVYPELKYLLKAPGVFVSGLNDNGQLGDNTTTSKSSLIQTVSYSNDWKQVSAGRSTVAIKTNGALWGWGRNLEGQLGDNSAINRSSPVQTVSSGTTWKLVSSGFDHSVAIKTDGTLWGWGGNFNGQLGDNSKTNKSSPVQTISGGTNWKLVSGGRQCTVAIKMDGTLWCWGRNTEGQLGDNTVVFKSSPVQTIAGGSNWKSIGCGYYHNSAIKTDGTLWCWGSSSYGQLGDNSIISKSSPVQTVTGGSNWKSSSCGDNHTAAIKTDGTLWMWGRNTHGQHGVNSVANKSSPVQTISGGTNWKSVSCGYLHTNAIKTDGTLWTWGYNNTGQLGDNTTINKSSPVQTISSGTTWKQVSGGEGYLVAIKEFDDF